ncbi:MAG: hypothetical protein L3J99_06660 [Thermoplasmata archaeon]|nr:hypothetical protein [Thermoplasmata archaeon]
MSRQGKIVLGVVLTLLAGVWILIAPDLTGALANDLPFLAAGLLSLFLGGILLGVGFGERRSGRED